MSTIPESWRADFETLTTDMLSAFASRIRHRTFSVVVDTWFASLAGVEDTDEWRHIVSDALLDELARRATR